MKIKLNGVQVAPFGPKLGQNDAPDLRIILDRFLDPKTQFKIEKSRFSSGRRHEAEPGKSAAVRLRTGTGVLGSPACKVSCKVTLQVL